MWRQTSLTCSRFSGTFWASIYTMPGKRRTAGIIVIGDEILHGSQVDTNSNFLCQRLYQRGIAVKKITVIGDVVAEIASNIAQFSADYDIVVTTGGIGPTHDDLTYEGLAAAFDDRLQLNSELKAVFDEFLHKYKQRSDAEEAIAKFCCIPSKANLIYGDNRGARKFPCVQMKNVIALPGVPAFCQQGFNQVESALFPKSDSSPFFSKNLYLGKNEIHIQHGLGAVAKKYAEDGVTIGSYPVIDNSYYKTKLIVQAPDDEVGNSAFNDLSSAFHNFVKNYDEAPWVDTVEKLSKFRETLEPEFRQKLDDAVDLIGNILKEYPYEEIMLSFNGGKDCTMLLHLLRVKMDEIYGPEKIIRAFHILCEDEFQELRHFLLDICWKYKVQLRELGGTMKAGLISLKEEEPEVKAVFMGSRSTDPRGKYMKSKCQWTDKDWPQFYRVCPMFDWTYSEVWSGLRGLCVPYCVLYDRGYTSLGDRSKTKPNPALKISGEDAYRPAYYLDEEHKERHGRHDSPPPPPPSSI